MSTPPLRIDLVSDTATRPTPAMREAMAAAPVGDESLWEDPSVSALCDRVAELTGKERAIFLPSGTMCNLIAICVHCRPGDEIVTALDSHIVNNEGAGAAVCIGSFVREVASTRGLFTPKLMREAIQPKGYARGPRTRLVSVEQTHNAGGGSVWPLEMLKALGIAAREEGLRIHMDGARLPNAAVASGVSMKAFSEPMDSVWIDFTKGLGCPIGAVLAGDRAFIEEAWLWKMRLGGAMRQAGIVAAAGLYALDHHVERLAEDHANARLLASALAEMPGVKLLLAPVETNLVFFDVAGAGLNAAQFAERVRAKGVRIGKDGATSLRAVTHIGISRADTLEAIEVAKDVLAAA
jgi:threonine aldolase